VAQAGEHLLCKHEALTLNPSPSPSTKKNRGKKIIFFKNITVIKDTEMLGKCSKLKEAKVTQLHSRSCLEGK
jgi:hypothetical protein